MSLPDPPHTKPAWRIDAADGGNVIVLNGDWIAQSGPIPTFSGFADAAGSAVSIEATRLGQWDSGLIEFLWDAKRAAVAAGMALDSGGLPDSARKLLGLLPDHLPRPKAPVSPGIKPLEWVGARTIGGLAELGILVTLLASTATGSVSALLGRRRIRGVDLLANIRDAGPSALLIVGVVNFLIGAIFAFVGASQLRMFAADAYVANLVGIALVREMAAVMTAIVMAGRTGGAYAARIATMEGGEEIDALRVTGISVSDYIVLPAVLALVFTLPLLYLYGCLIGLFGGFVISISMLSITGAGYLHQTIGAVGFDQFVFGFVKCIVFALLIGITSCRIGLKAGRSAADVGMAATRAVVVGIVGVIAVDAVFAVIADALGI